MIPNLWHPETVYLNTASFGFPPRTAYAALQRALEDWRHGRTSWEPWTEQVGVARAAFARIVGCHAEDVAVGATVSELVGLVAASLPDDARVVAPDCEFTSTSFRGSCRRSAASRSTRSRSSGSPIRSTRRRRSSRSAGCSRRAARSRTSMRSRRRRARTTHSSSTDAGVRLGARAAGRRLVCHGYKWLLAPRGTAFLRCGRSG